MKMSFGNGIGCALSDNIPLEELFGYAYGSMILEVTGGWDNADEILGVTDDSGAISYGGETVTLPELLKAYEDKLEPVYSCNISQEQENIPAFEYKGGRSYGPAVSAAKPKVLIPVFPGTNCEYDSARAVEEAGAEADIFVINNLTKEGITRSVDEFAGKISDSQIIFIPGGFSGGDEPDGSGKFITAFFRNEAIKAAVGALLDDRAGLMLGICNGFQALIKLGLVPYGRIIDTDESCPTLTFNTISRHQSRLVRTRVCTDNSPWLAGTKVGDIYTVPISHGEGRFIAPDDVIETLAANGQIATQYVDENGAPTDDIRYNPNGSTCAIEGILSPGGRVFGKMGHSERVGKGLYKNVPGEYEMHLFESAVKYFK